MTSAFALIGKEGLPFEEKLDLVSRLWDELLATVPHGGLLTEAQRLELRRRQADSIANPNDWVAWEDVRAASKKRVAP